MVMLHAPHATPQPLTHRRAPVARLATLPRHANVPLHEDKGTGVSGGSVDSGGARGGGTLTGMPGSPEGPASPSSPARPCTDRRALSAALLPPPSPPALGAAHTPLPPSPSRSSPGCPSPHQHKEATYQFSLLALGPCSTREALCITGRRQGCGAPRREHPAGSTSPGTSPHSATRGPEPRPASTEGSPCSHRQPVGTLLSGGPVATGLSLREIGGRGAEAREAQLPQTPLPPRPPAPHQPSRRPVPARHPGRPCLAFPAPRPARPSRGLP